MTPQSWPFSNKEDGCPTRGEREGHEVQAAPCKSKSRTTYEAVVWTPEVDWLAVAGVSFQPMAAARNGRLVVATCECPYTVMVARAEHTVDGFDRHRGCKE